LGYDEGHQELWDLIAEKFTENPLDLCQDTLFDSGGPWWSYGDNENYTETVISEYPGPLIIHFEQFNLESGYDSLWIYDGTDINSPLLSAFSGDQTPENLMTSANSFTIRFNSDGATERSGYALVWSCPTASINESDSWDVSIFPNPADDRINIILKNENPETWSMDLFDIKGNLITSVKSIPECNFMITTSNYSPGVYILKLHTQHKYLIRRLVITH
jgi:hypothetical protein